MHRILCKTEGSRPLLISLRQISLSIALKYIINPFPHKKILDQTKLKAFADNKLNVTKIIISVLDTVENIVEKGEIAPDAQFLIFPQCFQKASFLDASKGVIVWEWINNSV